MTSNQAANQQAARNAAIAALAAQQTAALWPNVDWQSPDAPNAIKKLYGAITAKYGRSTAAVASLFYDQQRAAHELPQRFTAVPAQPVPQPRIDRIVESAFLGNSQPDDHGHPDEAPTSDLPVEQRVPQRLDNTLGRLIQQPGRDTIIDNTAQDPAKPFGWARVPTSDKPCAFCVIMASKVYRSRQSASRVVGRGKTPVASRSGKRQLGEKYHDHCSCIAVPIFSEPMIGQAAPDLDQYFEMYEKGAADAGTHRDIKKILSSMRQLHGLK